MQQHISNETQKQKSKMNKQMESNNNNNEKNVWLFPKRAKVIFDCTWL